MSTTLILTALIATLFATSYLYVKYAFSYWKRRGVPYLKPSFPFGNFKDIFLQRAPFAGVLKNIYDSTDEPIIGIYSSFRPTLIVRDPKIARDILIKDFSSFQHRGPRLDSNVDPMADNILFQTGDKWRNARTKFTPAFTSGKLKGMFESVFDCTKVLIEYVERYADQGKPVEMRDVLARYSTNVIASVSFGINIDCLIRDRESDFRKYGKRVFEPSVKNAIRNTLTFFAPTLAYKLGVRFADKDIGEFMINTVKQNLEFREKNNVTRKDFFQMLMQLRNTGKIDETNDWSTKSSTNEKSLSLEEMSAQAFVFFAGGYETSSTTMSFCMYELARNPDVQQNAYEDVISSLEKHDGQFTYESVNDMKYIDNCIDETLRLHSPFGILPRECTTEYRLPNSDIVIEKGTSVFIPIDGFHYDKKYYDQPKKFMPDRFDERRSTNKSSLEMPFLPFGDGPRNCLGLRLGKLQSKLAIITLLQKFRFELGDEHKNKELILSPQSPSKCPINGINLKIFSR